MAPWWKRHHHRTRGCVRCEGNVDVHERLCRRCRAELDVKQTSSIEVTEIRPVFRPMPERPSLEPPHDRPWVHRGGG
jgi:hypothetical protein